MDDERRRKLEGTTRYDPAEVEQRVLEGWLSGGYFHPPRQPGGRRGRERQPTSAFERFSELPP